MNIIKKIGKKLEKRKVRLEREQEKRYERLSELEKLVNKPGFNVFSPVKSIKAHKEIKELKREIESYKNRKRDSILLTCMVCICFGLPLFFVLFSNSSNSEEKTDTSPQPTVFIMPASTPSTEQIQKAIQTDVPEKVLVEPIENTNQGTGFVTESNIEITEDKNLEVFQEQPIDKMSENETLLKLNKQEKSEQNVITENGISENDLFENEFCKITYKDYDISAMTDYCHFDSSSGYLGNEERLLISVSTSNMEATEEDFIVDYDETLLEVSISEEEINNRKLIKYSVKPKVPGFTEIGIFSLYDLVMQEEEAQGYYFPINKLSSSDGRIVYITPTGEKYHYSSSCAGDNAEKTTYYEADAYGYEPCGKCA